MSFSLNFVICSSSRELFTNKSLDEMKYYDFTVTDRDLFLKTPQSLISVLIGSDTGYSVVQWNVVLIKSNYLQLPRLLTL